MNEKSYDGVINYVKEQKSFIKKVLNKAQTNKEEYEKGRNVFYDAEIIQFNFPVSIMVDEPRYKKYKEIVPCEHNPLSYCGGVIKNGTYTSLTIKDLLIFTIGEEAFNYFFNEGYNSYELAGKNLGYVRHNRNFDFYNQYYVYSTYKNVIDLDDDGYDYNRMGNKHYTPNSRQIYDYFTDSLERYYENNDFDETGDTTKNLEYIIKPIILSEDKKTYTTSKFAIKVGLRISNKVFYDNEDLSDYSYKFLIRWEIVELGK